MKQEQQAQRQQAQQQAQQQAKPVLVGAFASGWCDHPQKRNVYYVYEFREKEYMCVFETPRTAGEERRLSDICREANVPYGTRIEVQNFAGEGAIIADLPRELNLFVWEREVIPDLTEEDWERAASDGLLHPFDR